MVSQLFKIFIYCVVFNNFFISASITHLIKNRDAIRTLRILTLSKKGLNNSHKVSQRTLSTGVGGIALTAYALETVAGACIGGACVGAKVFYDYFGGPGISKETKDAIDYALVFDPANAGKALEIAKESKISFQEAYTKVFNLNQKALEISAQTREPIESVYRRLAYAEASPELKHRMDQEAGRKIELAREIKNNFGGTGKQNIQINAKPELPAHEAETKKPIVEQENLIATTVSNNPQNLSIAYNQSAPPVFEVTNSQQEALIKSLVGCEFKPMDSATLQKKLSMLTPEMIKESEKYIKISNNSQTIKTNSKENKLLDKKVEDHNLPVSDIASNIATGVAANLAVRAIKHVGDNVFDYFELTPQSQLRKERAAVEKARSETQALREKYMEMLNNGERASADAEGKFFACMMQHGEANGKKIPMACKEAALFLAKFGDRSDVLLDYDGFACIPAHGQDSGCKTPPAPAFEQPKGCGSITPVVPDPGCKFPIEEKPQSTIECGIPLAKPEIGGGCKLPARAPEGPFILEKSESKSTDKPRATNSPDGEKSAQAPGMPTEKDGYEPPKKWDGKKVKAKNGRGYGYPDKNGNVWIPTGYGPLAHGGPHWDVQSADGKSYQNIMPGGHVRGQR